MIIKKKSTIRKLKTGKNCQIIEPVNIYESKFGNNVFVGPFVEIQNNTKIGNNTRIQSHSFICEKVTIGNNCFVGHGTMFINDLFKKGKVEKNKKKFLKTEIENEVLIGSNSTIFPVKIKKGSIIGAGSVVTKNLPTKGIYFGNPAKLIKTLK